MLPKKFRLTVLQFNQIPQKSNDFKAVFLSIRVKKANESLYPKFAIATPKGLDARSSWRHLTKRLISESIRSKLPNIKKPAYILVKAKKVIKKRDKKNLDKEINFLFKKASLL